jgi:hypothetical protein
VQLDAHSMNIEAAYHFFQLSELDCGDILLVLVWSCDLMKSVVTKWWRSEKDYSALPIEFVVNSKPIGWCQTF